MALMSGQIPAGFLADDQAHAVLIPLPPPNGGAAGWGPVWLSFGADFADVQLRVAIYSTTTKAWRVSEVQVPVLGDRATVNLAEGDQKVSVGRVRTGPQDAGTAPCAWMVEALLQS